MIQRIYPRQAGSLDRVPEIAMNPRYALYFGQLCRKSPTKDGDLMSLGNECLDKDIPDESSTAGNHYSDINHPSSNA